MQVELPGSVPQSCEVICVPGDPRDLEWVTEKLKRGFSVDWDNAYATYQRCGILVNLCLFASPKTFGIFAFWLPGPPQSPFNWWLGGGCAEFCCQLNFWGVVITEWR